MIFFYKESKSKKNRFIFLCFGGGGVGSEVARLSDFLQRIQI